MSYAQNGNNGYTNGSYGRGRVNGYEQEHQDIAPRDNSRARRAGGYGAFINDHLPLPADNDEPNPLHPRRFQGASNEGFARRSPERSVAIHDGRRRSRSRDGTSVSNARSFGSGHGGKQIEGVLQHIEENWDIMAREECVPVHIALQLMDHSSLGRGGDHQDFQRTSKSLQKALKAIVNEHHQGFNSSIGTFHKIQSSIQASQSRVRTLRNSVLDARTSLMTTKPELKGMGTSSQNYNDMLQVLGQIEKLQVVPEQLDARISDKHFLLAVDLLQDALRIIRRSDMENISALADLRIYFSNQETSLTDILIEELHDHVYLKSPYCQDRWKPYSPASLSSISSENADTWGRALYRFLDGLDLTAPMDDDASKNPEADSFRYVHIILEALNKLGHLDAAVDKMEQRLPVELFAIVDRTNQEVDLRHSSHLRGHRKAERENLHLDVGGDNSNNDVLKDLLWTLYSKFEAIAEGHRAVHDVVVGIAKREGLMNRTNLAGGFDEMWKLYQSEMRSLLHDYLATDGDTSTRLGRMPTVDANVFQKNPRDKNKRVFRLAEIDTKSNDLATEQEDLDQILKASVPGLVSKSQRRSSLGSSSRITPMDGPVASHKLLIDASVFNISLLLPPSLSFLQRLKDIVPLDSNIAISTLTSFLDDFLINVFHPQLEESVTDLCTQTFLELEAFQKEPQWSQHCIRPLFKGTCTFFALVQSFCRLLDTIPQDPAFTELILSQIVAYYSKCYEWYRALVARPRTQDVPELRMKRAATMAESGELRTALETIWKNGESTSDEEVLKEIQLLLASNQDTPFQPADIISDRRSVSALCLLRTSMTWLSTRLATLRHIVPEPSSKQTPTGRWTLLNLKTDTSPPAARLPLTPTTAALFDQTIASFRSLALTALLTLHLDTRIGIILMLSRTLQAPYLLANLTQEPDPSVLQLNSDLLSFDDTLTQHLRHREHGFITTGLAALTDATIIALIPKFIRVMNTPGCGRMQLNILVLQQNLKAIDADAVLSRSAEYFELFEEGPEAIVKQAREKGKEIGYSLEELKGLVELCYSEGLRSEGREGAVAARKGLGAMVLELSEVLWDT